MRKFAPLALAALVAGCSTPPDAAAPGLPALTTAEHCQAVTGPLIGGTEARGKWVAAANGLPAYCEVTGTLSPASGSTIGVVYRLPENWNGKLYGIGGGGWIGNIGLQAATEGLEAGYATMQTDAGHPVGNVWDAGWAANPEALKDFGYRALHETAVAGKKLARAHYGRPHSKAYYFGCSTGGRMGLMEAQRYPGDYDVVSAGAPVHTLQVQTSAVFRNQAFALNGGGFTPADLQLAQDAAVAACDADDGLKDGIINDPASCQWKPASLQCTGAKTATCLSAGQVTALTKVYDGAKANGAWTLLPLRRGGEAGWSAFVGTNGSGSDASYSALTVLFPLALGRPIDLATFSPADATALRRTTFVDIYEAEDANLQPFFARGGKLLLWHGESDPGPSPVATAEYAQAVSARSPGAAKGMRYFALPGVGHCAGGNGADVLPLLATVEAWDATGKAPEVLVGIKRGNPLVRPHCAWPKVARYKGSGEANDPASWQCVARS